MGFEALATTSAGLAHSLGVRDGTLTRAQVLQHCESIVKATDLPVSADLENGFGTTPEEVGDTIRLAAATGLAGGSIEDHTGNPTDPIFDFNQAVERIQAAVEAKNSLSQDFILTARSENHVWDCHDLDDTINRLIAFEKAGADVLYAPGLHDLESIRTVCDSVNSPVNVVIEISNTEITLQNLEDAGAKRISIGSVLFLSAYGSLYKAANEIKQQGSFKFASDKIEFSVLEEIFEHFE